MNPQAANGSHTFTLICPHSIDEGMSAVLAVRGQQSVVLDLSHMDAITAQRTADFVSGGVRALDGQEYQLGELVFLFTPATTMVTQSLSLIHI